MMQNKKLVFGVMIGALVGGLTTLFDKQTRSKTKIQCQNASNKTSYYLKHPSEAVRDARVACNRFNDSFNASAESAINALEQVENTIDKITKKEDIKRIDSIE